MITEERKEALLWCWENETDDEEWRDELTSEEQEMVNGWDTGYFEGIARMCAGNTLDAAAGSSENKKIAEGLSLRQGRHLGDVVNEIAD